MPSTAESNPIKIMRSKISLGINQRSNPKKRRNPLPKRTISSRAAALEMWTNRRHLGGGWVGQVELLKIGI